MKWVLKKSNKKIIKFNKDVNFSPLIFNLLNNRAFATFDELDRFLNPSSKYFHNPFLMKGMEGYADKNDDKKITAGELHQYI